MSTPHDEQPAWDARLTLQEAAALCGLSYVYLRERAANGDLRTERVGARLRVTTRRWLDDYLRARGTRGGGRGPAPKPLPAEYQAPPRRGRPPKDRSAARMASDEDAASAPGEPTDEERRTGDD